MYCLQLIADFTLRVAEKVKKVNSNIKTVHYVAPQVWVWREGRVEHILLLFEFEKKYFEKENVSCEVGHPLLQNKERFKIDINQIIKALISFFLVVVSHKFLIKFIQLMNNKYTDMTYVFHSTKVFSTHSIIFDKSNLTNCENCK